MCKFAAVANDVVQNLDDAAGVAKHRRQVARQVVDQLHFGLGLRWKARGCRAGDEEGGLLDRVVNQC